MIWIDPERVTLTLDKGEAALTNVRSVALNRRADTLIVETGDAGPHVVFADVTEQRVWLTIDRVVTQAEGEAEADVLPGAQGILTLRTALGRSDAHAQRVSAEIVVVSVSNEVSRRGEATQRIICLAISADGAAEPVSIEPAMSGGAS